MQNGLYLFAELSDQDVYWLASAGARLTVPDGETVIEQGRPTNRLLVVLAGVMSVRVDGIGEVARVGSGQVLGEVSFVDARPATATVRASGEVTVLAVPAARLREKLATDRDFAARFYRAIAQFLAARLRSITEHYSVAWDSEDLAEPELQRQADERFERLTYEVMGT